MKIFRGLLYIFTATILAVTPFAVSITPALSEELSITGNGADSQNSINVEVKSETNIQQSNNAEIENDVSIEANTGENEANKNNGDASIATGDISTETNIDNSNINTSVVNNVCCPTEESNLTISGNGAQSENSIGLERSKEINVEINNEAEIENDVSIEANTGRNEASKNNGDASIDTGNIDIGTDISNANINNAAVVIAVASESISASILDNGAESQNSIEIEDENEIDIEINNEADIENEVEVEANTGENFASGNIGDVAITTGDINIDTSISNEGVNVSQVAIICCEVTPTPTPTATPAAATPTPTPTAPPTGEPTPTPGAVLGVAATPTPTPSGEVLGAAAAQALPEAGNNWLAILTFIALGLLGTGIYISYFHPNNLKN